jgi:beta-lactamase class A
MKLDLLTTKLNKEISRLNGEVGLKVKYLKTGQEYTHNDTNQFWAASVIKVPLACTVYKQIDDKILSPTKRYTIQRENIVDGSGISKLFDPKTDFTLYDLIVMSITISDNSAANQLIDIVGRDSTEKYMLELGLKNTTLRHKMAIKAGRGPNVTTPEDMTILLEKLYRKELPGSRELLEIMKHTSLRDRMQDLIPNDILVSHKPGSLPEAVHEIGIAYTPEPFIFCFFSDDQKDKKPAKEVLSKCAKLCYDYSVQVTE